MPDTSVTDKMVDWLSGWAASVRPNAALHLTRTVRVRRLTLIEAADALKAVLEERKHLQETAANVAAEYARVLELAATDQEIVTCIQERDKLQADVVKLREACEATNSVGICDHHRCWGCGTETVDEPMLHDDDCPVVLVQAALAETEETKDNARG